MGKQLSLIFEFFDNVLFDFWDFAVFRQKVSDDAHVRFIALLTFALMMLPEVFVWSKNRQLNDFAPVEWEAADHQIVRQALENATAWTLKHAVKFSSFRIHIV